MKGKANLSDCFTVNIYIFSFFKRFLCAYTVEGLCSWRSMYIIFLSILV